MIVRQLIRLVGDEQDRPARAPQVMGDFHVRRGHAVDDVHHEQHEIAFRDRRLDLSADGAVQGVAGRYEASRVHQPKAAAIPLRRREVAVAGHAGARVHDRFAPADDAVEQRGLADVGAPDDGDGGSAHAVTPWPASASAKSYENFTGTLR